MFEGRALFYVFIVYVLVTNLLTTRRQYVRLRDDGPGGRLDPEHLLAHVLPRAARQRTGVVGEPRRALGDDPDERLVHLPDRQPSSFKCSRWLRWMSFLLAIPVACAYILSQRRAAMIALFVGVFILICVLYQRRRRAFWFVAPTTAFVGLGFVAGDVERPGSHRSAGPGRQDGAVPRSAGRGRHQLRPLPPAGGGEHLLHDPAEQGLRHRLRSEVPPTDPDAGHQLLRVLGVHPAQQRAVDLAQARLPRLRRHPVHVRPGGPARGSLDRRSCAPTTTSPSWPSACPTS